MTPASGQSSHAPLASLAAHWHACRGDIPPPLVGASVTLVDDPDPAKAKIFLFGGRLVTTRRMVNDLYELNLLTLRWTKLFADSEEQTAAGPSQMKPQPRYFHSCNLWEDKLIIFGGMGYVNNNESELCVLDEVVSFDLSTRSWDFNFALPAYHSSLQSGLVPEPRYAHLSSTTTDSLIIIGGQDMSNRYVEEINVLDLKQRRWIVKQPYEKQRGSYRSLAVEPQWRVEEPAPSTPQSVFARSRSDSGAATPGTSTADKAQPLLSPESLSILPMSSREWDERGKMKPLPVYVYTNYNFTDVKRETEIILVESNHGEDEQEWPNCKIQIDDQSHAMNGASLPPGLRFPMGAIHGSHLLISGTYLANTSQTFAIWALHLPSMTWSRLDVGPLLSTGSWNRGILWPLQSRLIVFGHRDRDLVADYNHRQTNWDHVLMIELEAWGITQPPIKQMSLTAVQLGLQKLASSTIGSFSASLESGLGPVEEGSGDPLLSLGGRGDFEIVCSDGMRLGCDRIILEQRWPWFAAKMRDYQRKVKALAKAGTPSKKGSRPGTGEQLAALLEVDEQGAASSANVQLRADPRITPRQLHINEPSPVMLALLIFLYTRCICTRLQRHPAIVAALLIVSKVYVMKDLELWAKHAAHVIMSRDLAPPNPTSEVSAQRATPSSTPGVLPPLERHRLAVALYEAATMCGFEALQIRALRTVMSIAKWVQRSSTSSSKSSNTADSSGADGTSSAVNPTTDAIGMAEQQQQVLASGTINPASRADHDVVSPALRGGTTVLASPALSRRSSTGKSSTPDPSSSLAARRPVRSDRSPGLSEIVTTGDVGNTAVSGPASASASRTSLQSAQLNPPSSQRRPSAPVTMQPANGAASRPPPAGNATGTTTRKRFSIFGRVSDQSKMATTPLEQHDERGRSSVEQNPSTFARLHRTNTSGSVGGDSNRSVNSMQATQGSMGQASHSSITNAQEGSSVSSLREKDRSEGSLAKEVSSTAGRKVSSTLSRLKTASGGSKGNLPTEEAIAGATVITAPAKIPPSPGVDSALGSPGLSSSGAGSGSNNSAGGSKGSSGSRMGAGQLNQKDIKALHGIFA